MKKHLLACLAVFAFALALRLWPIEHGFPRNYLPDTHAVRAALGMAKDKDLAPPVGKYSTYPLLMPYVLLPVYAAEYALGKAQGRWSDSQDFGAKVAEEPALVQLPARWVVAIFGALTASATWLAARALGLRRGAWVAAFLTATALLHLQFSVQERPWIQTLFFGALCVWCCAHYMQATRARWLLWAGAMAGLSFASHQVGGAWLALCGLTWLCAPSRGMSVAKRLALGTSAVAAFVVVGVLFGHAYYLTHSAIDPARMAGGEDAAHRFSIGGQAAVFGLSLDSLKHLSKSFFGYDPVLCVLGVLGLAISVRNKPWRPIAIFTVVYAAVFLAYPADHVRYLLPLTVLLPLFAGAFAERAMASRWGTLAVGTLCAFALVQALRLGFVLRQEDTRAEAERLCEDLASRSDVLIATDHYGPDLDLSQKALEQLSHLRDLRTREAHRLELLKAGNFPNGRLGVNAIAVEELFEVDPKSGVYGVKAALRGLAPTPREMFEALRVTHFVLVNRRPSDESAPFLAELVRDWPPLLFVDPSRTDRLASEAFLPTEMDFPLTGLWQVRRPGPWIALYEVPR